MMKRSAAAHEYMRPAKKAHQVEPVEQMCSTVSGSVMEAPYVVSSAREMLGTAVPHSFAVFTDKRHRHQEDVIDMIEDALVEMETGMKQSISDADAVCKVHVVHTTKLASAKTSFGESQCNVSQIENAHAENMLDLSKIERIVRERECAALEHLSECNAILHKQHRMRLVQNDCLAPLKEGSVKTQPQMKEKINSLISMEKSMQLDASLLNTFPRVLAKVPAERGSFDLMTLRQLEAAFSTHFTEIAEQLDSRHLILNRHNAEMQVLLDLLTQSQEKCRASEESLNASSVRNSGCEEKLRPCNNTFGPDVDHSRLVDGATCNSENNMENIESR